MLRVEKTLLELQEFAKQFFPENNFDKVSKIL